MGRDHITLQILTFWLNFILAVVPHSASSSGKDCTITCPCPTPSTPLRRAEDLHNHLWAACLQGEMATPAQPRPLQHSLLPDGVNVKLIPDSYLSHTDLINSNSFSFVGWRVSGFRSALPETKCGQLCMLMLQMHGKEKKLLCAATQER